MREVGAGAKLLDDAVGLRFRLGFDGRRSARIDFDEDVQDVRARGRLELFVPLVINLAQLGVARIHLRAKLGVIGDEVLGRALFAVRVLRLMRRVVLLHLGRRHRDVGRLARGGIEDVLDLGAFAVAAVLGLGRLRRDDDGALERALHLAEGDLARQLLFELGGRLKPIMPVT